MSIWIYVGIGAVAVLAAALYAARKPKRKKPDGKDIYPLW
jgi:hypothetical protein